MFLGENFSEEMLVMKDFSNSQMDAFLQFFRDNQLKNVDLKASPHSCYRTLEFHGTLP